MQDAVFHAWTALLSSYIWHSSHHKVKCRPRQVLLYIYVYMYVYNYASMENKNQTRFICAADFNTNEVLQMHSRKVLQTFVKRYMFENVK